MASELKIIQDKNGPLAIKTTKGYVLAIRYAKGMSSAEVLKSMLLNEPLKSEWRPFNESTMEFC